jgi:hypothetical protein
VLGVNQTILADWSPGVWSNLAADNGFIQL